MEKKPNQTIRDFIVDEMETSYPRALIEKIISFQGEQMLEASRTCREIEISGFGLLYVAKGKLSRETARAEKALATCISKLEASTTPEDIVKNTRKVEDFTNKVAFLKSKNE